MTNETNHGREQAEAQMRSVKTMVAALDVDYDRLEELRDERASLERDASQEYDDGPDCDEAREARAALAEWTESYAAELAELETDADGNESADDARDRITEDALSVEVRSDWETIG